MFKFTFNAGNSISNPFTAEAEERERIQRTVAPQTIARKLPPPPHRPLPPDPEPAKLSKKRGWTPAVSSASTVMSQPTISGGWIDTPSRYLKAALQSQHSSREDDLDADIPPAKRRKTMMDTIVSTALSAALIGTAVGMSAYRMWRDKGKAAEDSSDGLLEQPPPPYEMEEWVDDSSHQRLSDSKPRLPRKPRPVPRRTPRRRKIAVVMSPPRSPTPPTSSKKLLPFPQEGTVEDQSELEDQMDWMGDKIRQLIEDGQKALGKEVVVMSDEQGDEEGAVDDGSGDWEIEDSQQAGSSSPRRSDYRRRRKSPNLHPINTSMLSPKQSNFIFSVSNGAPISPRSKRSRAVPGITKMGHRSSNGTEDIKVIYDPFPALSEVDSEHNEDEESRRLTERMESIRRAYRIRVNN